MNRSEPSAPEGGDAALGKNAQNQAGGAYDSAAELADVKDRLLRTLADQENVRRKAQRDRDQAVRYAVSGFAADLLEVADNLERAIASVEAEARADHSVKDLLAGIEATRRSLLDAFAKHGLTQFAPVGEPFDPNQHEAGFEIADDRQPAGSVVSVVRPGYRLHDRLLRPALVGVGKPPSGGGDNESGPGGGE
jgi:molecular chaperone GrpE